MFPTCAVSFARHTLLKMCVVLISRSTLRIVFSVGGSLVPGDTKAGSSGTCSNDARDSSPRHCSILLGTLKRRHVFSLILNRQITQILHKINT